MSCCSEICEVQHPVMRVSLSGAVRIGSEVTEEELQLALEPVLRSLILKEDFSAPDNKQTPVGA